MVPQLRVLLMVVVVTGCGLIGADASATSKANEVKALYVKIVHEGQEEGKACDVEANNKGIVGVVEYAGVTGAEIVSNLKKEIEAANKGSYSDQDAEAFLRVELKGLQDYEKDTKKTRCIAKKELVCVESKCVKCKDAKEADNAPCGSIKKIAKAGGGMKTPMMAVGTILVALLAFFSSQ